MVEESSGLTPLDNSILESLKEGRMRFTELREKFLGGGPAKLYASQFRIYCPSAPETWGQLSATTVMPEFPAALLAVAIAIGTATVVGRARRLF